MKPASFFISVLFIMVFSCKAAKYTDAQFQALETLIKNKNFKIESDRANPQITNAMQQVLNSGILQPGNSAGVINLIGNSNFLTISGDSITSYLPYFGERQMNISYGGGDSAIQLKGIMKNYIIKKGKHHRSIISFNVKSNSENFDVHITLFPNFKSEIHLIGSGRLPISYSGQVKLQDKE